MIENESNCNKMSVEKIEGGLIQVRKGFSELRPSNADQMDVLDCMNTALYKLEQKVSDIRKVFYGE